jgi:hypothetical protein
VRGRPLVVAVAAAVLLVGVASLRACDHGGSAPRDDGPPAAAAALIERAPTAEERLALERVRDETDREMRSRVRALDVEIEALRRENDELRRKLREP